MTLPKGRARLHVRLRLPQFFRLAERIPLWCAAAWAESGGVRTGFPFGSMPLVQRNESNRFEIT